MGKSYEELLGVTAERFLSPESFAHPVEKVDVDAMSKVVKIYGANEAWEEADRLARLPKPAVTHANSLTQKGITHVMRTIAFFGEYDEESIMRCLLWTANRPSHSEVVDDLKEQAHSIAESYPKIKHPLIPGYVLNKVDGVQIIYNLVGDNLPSDQREALKSVSLRFPDVEHTVKWRYDQVPVSVDTL
jgi:hypothetical protein